MIISAPSSTAQPTISSNMERTSACADLSFGCQMLVFEMLPAIRLPGLSSATFLASRSAARFSGSSRLSLPMTRIFSR